MTRLSLLARLRRMNQRSLFGPGKIQTAAASDALEEGEVVLATTGARAEAVQRLQIGVFGIGAMLLLVGLASIIGTQADLAEEAAVPEAAPTTEPTAAPTQANPLADAGIVPDIAAEPSPSPALAPLDLPSPQPSGSGNAPPPQ